MSRFSLKCIGRFVVVFMVVAWLLLSVLLTQLPVYVERLRGSLVDVPIAKILPRGNQSADHFIPHSKYYSSLPNQKAKEDLRHPHLANNNKLDQGNSNKSDAVPIESDGKVPKFQLSSEKTITNAPISHNDMWFYQTKFDVDIWETQSGKDRIIEQLAYTKELSKTVTNTTKHKIILQYPGSTQGINPFEEQECYIKQCTISENSVDAKIADAILFSNTNSFPNFPRKNNQIWIYYRLESPLNTAIIPSHVRGRMNWTATYRLDSTIVTPYEKFVLYDPNVLQNPHVRNYAKFKTKMVAWFVSNCRASNNRLQYAQELGKYIGVDIYGRCGPLTCARKSKDCFKMLNTDYKFYLAFENSNCIDYITEKFYWNGLW